MTRAPVTHSTRLKLAAGTCAATALLLVAAAPAAADFTVNDLGDADDATFPDGTCDTVPGGAATCTLRAAIQEANGTVALDNITFSVSGQHSIATTLPFVTSPVSITGNGNGSGAGNTIVDGADATRLIVLSHSGLSTMSNIRLQNGSALAGQNGGAINTAADLTLTNVVVTSNQAVTSGGNNGAGAGIFSGFPRTLTVQNSTVSDNTISATGGGTGAGISSGGPLNITDSTVSGNQITAGTGNRGGGIFADNGLTMERTTVSGNSISDSGSGAGVYLLGSSGTRTILNSTISTNTNTGTSTGGGGLHANAGTSSLTNVTLANNTGGSGGGGQGDDVESAGGTLVAQNSIFASASPCFQAGGTIQSQVPGHNVDVGTTCAFGATQGNQQNVTGGQLSLGGLALNAPGTTQTHALGPTSVALDAADPTCGTLTTDQRGVSRPQPAGGICDVGAFEREYRLLTVTKAGAGSGTVTATGINCGGDCSENVVDSRPVVLTATAAGGSTFSSWAGCDSVAGNQCTQTVGGGNETVTATFTANPPTAEDPRCAALRAKLAKLSKKIKRAVSTGQKAKLKKQRAKVREQLAALGC